MKNIKNAMQNLEKNKTYETFMQEVEADLQREDNVKKAEFDVKETITLLDAWTDRHAQKPEVELFEGIKNTTALLMSGYLKPESEKALMESVARVGDLMRDQITKFVEYKNDPNFKVSVKQDMSKKLVGYCDLMQKNWEKRKANSSEIKIPDVPLSSNPTKPILVAPTSPKLASVED
jgi:hypothetical protein